MQDRVNPDEIIQKLSEAIQELLRQRDELDNTYHRDRQIINDKLARLGHPVEQPKTRKSKGVS